jgi:hypothetical protein
MRREPYFFLHVCIESVHKHWKLHSIPQNEVPRKVILPLLLLHQPQSLHQMNIPLLLLLLLQSHEVVE